MLPIGNASALRASREVHNNVVNNSPSPVFANNLAWSYQVKETLHISSQEWEWDSSHPWDP